eukprot:TRINITY_DN11184_c0_g1_i1.p1 TRINITY_DN11184_c0_g1~~TRINITY_DN11184_c0_g1_i1.p1  ORF type:complete len:694 (-),score=150.46 TRINITY_DN11184_c0_g1_i1:312-2393(-)
MEESTKPNIENVHVFRQIYRYCAVFKDEPMLRYACEALESLPLEFVEFYLPQLAHLVVHFPQDSAPVERFLVKACERSAPIAIQLIWLFESCLGDLTAATPTEKQLQSRCLSLIDTVKAAAMQSAEHTAEEMINEMDMQEAAAQSDSLIEKRVELKENAMESVNQDAVTLLVAITSLAESVQESTKDVTEKDEDSKPLLQQEAATEPSNTQLNDSVDEGAFRMRMKILCNKMIVFETFQNQLAFIERLLDIGNKLVAIWPPERREAVLQANIEAFNKTIPDGLFIPLCYSSDYCHTIVNIIPDESRIFNSRTRAPYMLIVEVRKIAELSVSDIASKKWFLHPPSSNAPDYYEGQAAGIDYFNDMESTTEILSNMLQTSKRLSKLPSNMNFFSRSSLSSLNDIRKTPYGELWCMKKHRLRAKSKFGSFPDWDVIPMIVKVGDDLRQEQLAAQMIGLLNQIFQDADLSIWLKPYRFIVTNSDSGLVEVLTDCVSIHQLKKGINTSMTLGQYFEEAYRSTTDDKLRLAKRNFVESLAGYSIVCYLLQVKDRHNGNILIHLSGHIIHIDYGFILGMSPGGVNFEVAPFKFTKEYLEVMGGQDSEYFSYFKLLFVQGLLEARKHMEDIILLAQLLLKDSKLPCLQNGEDVVHRLIERFQPDLSDENFIIYAQKLIYDSIHCWSTTHYDSFQYLTNGIY